MAGIYIEDLDQVTGLCWTSVGGTWIRAPREGHGYFRVRVEDLILYASREGKDWYVKDGGGWGYNLVQWGVNVVVGDVTYTTPSFLPKTHPRANIYPSYLSDVWLLTLDILFE